MGGSYFPLAPDQGGIFNPTYAPPGGYSGISSQYGLPSSYGGGMGGLAGVLGGIGGITDILGSLFGSSQTTNTSGTTSSQYGQTPTYDPAAESLRQALISGQISNLGKDVDLSGYTSSGLQTINQGYDAANKALQQTLASRGLTYSPVAGSSTAALGTQRIGAGINFQNQIPLLAQQLYQQKLQGALQTFASMPYSVSGQQNQQTQGKSTQSGGGLLSGLFG